MKHSIEKINWTYKYLNKLLQSDKMHTVSELASIYMLVLVLT